MADGERWPLLVFILAFIALLSSLLVESNDLPPLLNVKELASETYGLDILNVPVLLDLRQDDVVHIANKFGQLYQCSLPSTKPPEEDDTAQMKGKNLNFSIVEVLDKRLSGQCLTYAKDWWTYKYCYKKSIIQYHADGSGKTPANTVTLGLYESEKNWSTVKNVSKLPPDLAFHSQKYTNGSLCDLTKQSRESLVKLRCDPDGKDGIYSVEEPATCSYIITINLKSLCTHPLLAVDSKPKAKPITCAPALNTEQYNVYQDKQSGLDNLKPDLNVEENLDSEEPQERIQVEKSQEPPRKEPREGLSEDDIESKESAAKEDGGPEIIETEISLMDDNEAPLQLKAKSKIGEKLAQLQQHWRSLEERNKELIKKEGEIKKTMKWRIAKTRRKLKREVKELQKLLIKIARKKKRKSTTDRQKAILERLLRKTQGTVKKVWEQIRKLEKKMDEVDQEMPPQLSIASQFTSFVNLMDPAPSVGSDIEKEDKDSPRKENSKSVKHVVEKQSLSDIISKILETVEKARAKHKELQDVEKTEKSHAAAEKPSDRTLSTDDSLDRGLDAKTLDGELDNELDAEDHTLSKENEKKASKEMEDLVKEELATVGLNIGGNVKVKIITDPAEVKKYSNAKTVDSKDSPDFKEFKDLLVGLLGGRSSQQMEEERRSQMEENYNFVWNEEHNSAKEDAEEQHDEKIIL